MKSCSMISFLFQILVLGRILVPIVQGSCSLHGQAEVIGSLNPDPFAQRLIAMLEVEVT